MMPKSLQKQVLSWPQIPPGEFVAHPDRYRGQVVHKVYQHESWCRIFKTSKSSDCSCNPTISYYLQPKQL
jgi:hypothetical protein